MRDLLKTQFIDALGDIQDKVLDRNPKWKANLEKMRAEKMSKVVYVEESNLPAEESYDDLEDLIGE